MRRSSYTPEPLIVVEEAIKEDDEKELEGAVGGYDHSLSDEEVEDDGTDPAYLCPWRDPRDLRKRSLPTPSCTSGITASQVRRLSEGRQTAIAKESAFLATLTTAPAPGRRHSVTISKIPQAGLFNRTGRRESFAAFPVARRDSSSFNLHLDIMDDIAEIKGARKAKMKIYKTDSREQVCEVEESGTSGSPVRFQSMVATGTLRAPIEARRHSEAAGLASLVPPLAVQPKRKSSEQLTIVGASGIVCTNSDLRTLLSLTSSAQEINSSGEDERQTRRGEGVAASQTSSEKRSKLKDSRSSSFDVAILGESDDLDSPGAASKGNKNSPTSWFAKRHQPMAKKDEAAAANKIETPKVTFTAPEELPPPSPPPPAAVAAVAPKGRSKRSHSCVETAKRLVWDRPSGSVVDAHILGSAIEDFLRRGGEASTSSGGAAEPEKGEEQANPPAEQAAGSSDQAQSTAPTTSASSTGSSICSTLKDLFVK